MLCAFCLIVSLLASFNTSTEYTSLLNTLYSGRTSIIFNVLYFYTEASLSIYNMRCQHGS